MNLLADALVPYLLSNGIQYKRNRPEMTAGASVREANAGTYDFYLALHSNGAPEGHYGEERGIIAFYYHGSSKAQQGHHTGDHYPGGGEPVQGPGGTGGNRLPRQLR